MLYYFVIPIYLALLVGLIAAAVEVGFVSGMGVVFWWRRRDTQSGSEIQC